MQPPTFGRREGETQAHDSKKGRMTGHGPQLLSLEGVRKQFDHGGGSGNADFQNLHPKWWLG